MIYLYACFVFIGFFMIPQMIISFIGRVIFIFTLFTSIVLSQFDLVIVIPAIVANFLSSLQARSALRNGDETAYTMDELRLLFRSRFILVLFTIIFLVFQIKFEFKWYYFLVVLAFFLYGILDKARLNLNKTSLFYKSVVGYEVIEKYEDGFKWAVYFHFEDGESDWSQTKPESQFARHPQYDLTWVFSAEKDALNYAKRHFKNAQYLD